MKKIDWTITLVPFSIIVLLCIFFMIFPEESNQILSQIRFLFGDTLGVFYLIVGLGIFLLSLYLCFSKYGKIVLGNQNEKPKYSFFAWGSMMFTAGLAADILFYSFSEWMLYATNPYVQGLGRMEEWAGVFPVFHWSFIPWGFYLVLAVSFGFMMHTRKRTRQRFSEACRPLLGHWVEGYLGKLIDMVAVFALIAGTATTFSLATPLMASLIETIFHVSLDRNTLTIVILILTCVVYTYALLHGIKGIQYLSKACIYLFFFLLFYVLVFGGQASFIIESGLSSFGKMIQNFIGMATYTDPLRKTSFPQDWTIFYWAYWMVWCVAAPFFIGSISKGRTVKQTIIGGYVFGVGSTLISFIILGNYSLGLQVKHVADFLSQQDLYISIIDIVRHLPMPTLVMVILLLTMIAFYATSFDSIALIASYYSYKKLDISQKPSKRIELLWCILLILLPIALIFSDSSMHNLQSISIIAAFPIGVIIVLIVLGFLKDAKSIVDSQKGD